jgi:hypothetical protein
MTVLATSTARRLPTSHAYATPVVREITRPASAAAADVW